MSRDPQPDLAAELPPDLREALATLLESANVCRLLTLADLDDAVPARPLGRAEAEAFLAALAGHGLHLIEPGAVVYLTGLRLTKTS